MIEDSKEYWPRVEDTNIINLKSIKNRSTLLQLLHFLIKYIIEKKTRTKYEINKIMSIQSKDFHAHVCQNSRDSTAVSLLITFFLEAIT